MGLVVMRKVRPGIWAALFLAGIIVAGCGFTTEPTRPALLPPPTIAPTAAAEAIEQGLACPDAGRPIQDPIVLNQAGDLVAVSASGQQVTRLTALPSNVRAYAPAWSPDGQTLAFALFFPAPDAAISWLQVGMICGMDRQTGKGRILARGATATESLEEATWTPDGRTLLLTHTRHMFNERKEFVSSDIEIARYDLRTGSLAPLIPDAVRPALSPDGRQLAFLKLDLQMGGVTRTLMVAQADGQQARALLDPQGGLWMAEAPRWSPDGRRLLFAASGGPEGQSQPAVAGSWWHDLFGVAVAEAHGDPANLWLIGSDGQGLERLTANPIDDPRGAWSSDGGRIVYITTLGAVTLLDLNSRTEQRLTNDGFAGLIDWNWH